MKKLIFIISLILISILFVSCANKETEDIHSSSVPSESSSDNSSNVSSESSSKKVVIYSDDGSISWGPLH